MSAKFLKLLGLLGAKYMLDENSENEVNQQDLDSIAKTQKEKYKISPAGIHKRLRESETEEERNLRLRLEAMGRK